ncbi:sterol desaturase family protein [Ferrimonas balearica]|uniref:sterol desaturase family protein n=1 Tax=Ferrimonas balearica TaxID=44012 RepID=UPI001C98FB8E|nr:sterol desaturase family protein [Ferrimonas balearica]MBY5992641.1 sterol desaturase family protein [Ferrimonas balearica]
MTLPKRQAGLVWLYAGLIGLMGLLLFWLAGASEGVRFSDRLERFAIDTYDAVLLFALGFLLLEIGNDVLTGRFSAARLLETGSSLLTQVPYYFAEGVAFVLALTLYFGLAQWVPWSAPNTLLTFALVLLAADLVYYIEHRCMHRVRLLWLAHSVHHSSDVMNTATAFRFSVFDPFITLLFHLPLILLGVDPVLLLAAEILVQAYQLWLHNEMIGKLGPLEWVFNTPSHHRVHHGSDPQYIDKNYGGILILWDRLFGTFAEEQQTPRYGLTTAMTSINPVTVQFYEFPRLWRDLRRAPAGQRWALLVKPPGWAPHEAPPNKPAEIATKSVPPGGEAR